MKITVDVPDPLLEQVRKMAADRKTTIGAIIAAALRKQVARRKRPKTRFHLETPSFGGKGLQPGLSWDDWSTITDLSYEGRGS